MDDRHIELGGGGKEADTLNAANEYVRKQAEPVPVAIRYIINRP